MKLLWRNGLLLIIGIYVVSLISCFNPKNYQAMYSWSEIHIDTTIEKSTEMEQIITPYRLSLDSIMDEVIGYAKHDLRSSERYESALGTFVTKLILDQSRATFEKEVDIAIMNHNGGLRAPINKGDITLGNIYEVMPFENQIILLEMTGSELLDMIQFIGKSGRSMAYPVSYEVNDDGVSNILLSGEEVIPEEEYVLAVSDYMANGGSGFRMLKNLPRIDVETIMLRDMIVKEVKDRSAQGLQIEQEVMNNIVVHHSESKGS